MLVLGAASGGLLFVSDAPAGVYWIQLFALLPWLAGLALLALRWWHSVLSGLGLGLAYAVPTLAMLDFPWLADLGFGLGLALQWALLSALVGGLFSRWPPVWAALGAGALAALVEWIQQLAVPMWGTAQCWVRVWSACPACIQLASLAGMLGAVFALVAIQALAVQLALAARALARGRAAVLTAALAGLLGAAIVADAALWAREPQSRIKVAAVGWTYASWPHPASPVLERHVLPALSQAADGGAALLACPEVGLYLEPGERQTVLARLQQAAAERRIWVAAGIFDVQSDTNRIVWIAPDGRIEAEYVKHHLVPFFETYPAGDGEPVLVEIDAARAGGIICQDDNFTDLSRALGREGCGLVAVPTNDWAAVAPYHQENSLWRPVESAYGLVRATTNGTSLIASARGETLASCDHLRQGPGLVTAELPLYVPGSAYAHCGDWPVLAACALLLAAGALAARRSRGIDKQDTRC
ncbi:MAG: hypothetical protein JXR96_22225 [Deltaproteobacteria bacterium]|nr:hypothetical protein [Deltaproteobacteria bacterium]